MSEHDPAVPMTEAGGPESEDQTATDNLVEFTGNGLTAEDPDDQPSQDPTFLPEGTEGE